MSPATIVIGAAGVAYPTALYFAGNAVPPIAFAVAAITLIAARIMAAGRGVMQSWRVPLIAAALAITILSLCDAGLAAKAYPVVVSLAAATAFAWSLWHPPSLIARFAAVRTESLSPETLSYCQVVTAIWAVWLVVNALVASALALADRMEAWTLWTGGASYMVSGALLAGEFLVRRMLLRPSR